mmetsp:Transcript_22704/g.51935  ORF Transcript_22704/g.51935 Transcript_22704/m.51935 type:complete len:143 (+) Transcript_22704:319-747(+)
MRLGWGCQIGSVGGSKTSAMCRAGCGGADVPLFWTGPGANGCGCFAPELCGDDHDLREAHGDGAAPFTLEVATAAVGIGNAGTHGWSSRADGSNKVSSGSSPGSSRGGTSSESVAENCIVGGKTTDGQVCPGEDDAENAGEQ